MRKLMILPVIAALILGCNSNNAEEAKTGEAKKSGEAVGEMMAINTESSELHWRGVKPTGEHYGTVGISGGEVAVEEGKITGGTININLNNIICEDLEGDMNARLVGHLKSEDFFYVEEYPRAKFEIVSAEKFTGEASEDIAPTHEITGNLTMRGETKSISFPAMVKIEDGMVMAKTNEFAIDRTLWGVNFKSKKVFAELKDDFINDMINLKFDVTFDN